VPTLVEAIAQLGPANTPVHLHIYGDGSDRGRIEHVIARESLQQQVTLHGSIERPQTALARSALLVLPSLAEGFGLVLIDVVRPNETGLLAPPGNPATLAAAIRQMIDDPALRQRLIVNAARDVRERFAWDRVLPLYRTLLRL
jgi:glycosyltransferase involved in cell wall biosynthesis